MFIGIVLAVLFIAFLIWGSGKSDRRKHLDELGLGADPKTGSGEQIYDANSFEHSRPDDH
jgi:hypothetical protein